MSHYKPYPAYRDSGIKWIGDVPSDWEVARIKRTSSLRTDRCTDAPDGAQYIGLEDVESGTGQYRPTAGSARQNEDSTVGVFKSGDVLYGKLRPYLKKAIVSDADGVCSTEFLVLQPKTVLAPWLHQWLLTTGVTQQIEAGCEGTKMPRADWEHVGSIHVPSPDAYEQAEIIAVLDCETKRIDSLITKKTRFIELLKEKRQALITHAVTKGLDANVKMRDSKVEWIGEVPEHWEVKSIGYVLDAVGDVDHFMPMSVEKGVPYLMTGDLKELVSRVNLEDCKQVSRSDYAKLSKRIKSTKGDVILARYATIGTSMYVDIDIDFLVSYSCVTIKTTPSKVSGLYLFQYLKSDAFYQGISNQTNTNTQGNVGINDLKKVKMVLPSPSEQCRIIEYLNSKLKNIDGLTEKTQSILDLLKERRSAFITAAVTGQIDLRESA